MNNTIKQILVYAGILIFFAIISYGFVPQVFSGKVLNQSDTASWKGMTHEIAEHNAEHPDDKTLWTNSMFGGMPVVTMYDDFAGDWTKPVYKFLMSGLRPANWLLISLIGAFLLMLAFGIDTVLAVAGAIAVTFCSYNFQIIQVGHNTKMQAIAFMPWVLAGIVFTYRSALAEKKSGTGNIYSGKGGRYGQSSTGWKSWLPKTILGAVLFALALSMQIKANHPQITYYLAIIILIYAIVLFISTVCRKEKRYGLGRFFAASALLLVIGGIGIATNLNKLIPTYKYTQYTMRGGSELSPSSDTHNDKGLDLAYATAWSYGIEEIPNLMIPNFNGGSSAGPLDKNSETYKLLKRAGQPNLNSVMKSLPLYWGPQPFTAGPMYMGAITVFLFIFGLCLYRGKEKWWLLVATVIAIFLAWGSHFMWFTRLWFEYAPMYNKFRTVSMALVALQITLPVLGFLVLDKVLKQEYNHKKVVTSLFISGGITAGFCLLFVIFPGLAGSFTGSVDAGQPDVLVDALAADRRNLLTKDALRAMCLVLVTAFLLLWCFTTKHPFAVSGRLRIASFAICALVLFDLWSVGKRYLNKEDFVTKKDFSGQFAQRPVDKMIHEDPDLDYRVLDISVNTFNDAHQSYHHRCIGGYSPAKLQRYQDLIDRYLSQEINSVVGTVNSSQTIQDVEAGLPYLPVTSMLNGKYIIVGGEYPPVVNQYAFGNAWFVDSAVQAETPDEEISLLGSTDLRNTAVIGRDFGWASEQILTAPTRPQDDKVGTQAQDDMLRMLAQDDKKTAIDGRPQENRNSEGFKAGCNADDSIEMVSYAANELRYRYNVAADRAVVFSEIYYPEGWKAWIIPADGSRMASDETGLSRTADTDMAVAKDSSAVKEKQDIELFRADWILRGAILPAGEGELVMRFEPQSYKRGEALSRASSITLLILLLLSIGGMVAFKK